VTKKQDQWARGRTRLIAASSPVSGFELGWWGLAAEHGELVPQWAPNGRRDRIDACQGHRPLPDEGSDPTT
jgi:hypothetical protein